jgi:hypothetical protein
LLDVIGYLAYNAALSGLRSGTYGVTLVHAYLDANWPSDTLFLGTVPVL